MDALTLSDPTREETEAAAELLSEILRQPNDGYWASVAEDMLRAAARVRLRNGARVKLTASCMGTIGVPDALVAAVLPGSIPRPMICDRCECPIAPYQFGPASPFTGRQCECEVQDAPLVIADEALYLIVADHFDCFGIASIDRLGAIIGFEADIASEQVFDRMVRS